MSRVTSKEIHAYIATLVRDGVEYQAEIRELKAALEHSQANLQIVGKSMDKSELLLIAAQDEIAGIVDACGFEYDSDPEAPRTLAGYVRSVHEMAVDQAEHVTSDHIDAAVRRLSISSRHARARLARTTTREGGGA